MHERERERERERGRGGDTHYISMGRDVLTKEVLFGVCLERGGVFHCKTSGNGFKYNCLERGPCLSGRR